MAVIIDGVVAAQTDADGYAVIDTTSGKHSIALRAADGRTWGPRAMEFDPLVNALAPFDTSGTPQVAVTFDTNIAGASLWIGGRVVATTGRDGRVLMPLPFGVAQRVRIAKGGFATFEARITPGTDRHVAAMLAPLDPPRTGARTSVTAAVGVLTLLVMAATAVLIVVVRRARPARAPRRGRHTEPLAKTISFDRYKLTEIIGKGGLATVYRASDVLDGSELALKILESKWIDDPEMVQKFFAEAEALQEILGIAPHAAVVRCFASGREGGRVAGQPFIAMELLIGETLEEQLARDGAMSENVAAAIGAQIAWALAAAHESGVVHRDLTPDNIFLLEEKWLGCESIAPRAVVLDFGVARVEVLSRRTLEISISGKPGYMAPEQTFSPIATPQMDLYALGVVLYEMAAGAPPFRAQTPDELMRMHAHEPAPELPEAIGEPFRALVRALMAKDPSARPMSALAVAGRLELIADGACNDVLNLTVVAHSATGGLGS